MPKYFCPNETFFLFFFFLSNFEGNSIGDSDDFDFSLSQKIRIPREKNSRDLN